MEKYLEGETLSPKEINIGIKEAVLAGEMVPVVSISSLNQIGIDMLLDVIVNILPSPLDSSRDHIKTQDPAAVFIFKTIADPYVGRLSLFKVFSGKIVPGMEMYNLDNDKKEKINHIYTMCGKKQIELEALNAGDIGAFSKLSDTLTNHILSSAKDKVDFEKIHFAAPNIFLSISPKSKGDEDKLGSGIARIREEDQTVMFERNGETNQNLIHGIGEMHIEILASKLKSRYGVDVELDIPRIPYRETIKKKAIAEGKHKKQSGVSGQFGVVSIEFEPTFDLNVPLEFVDKVVGGTVPRQYIPAVEKGLRKAIDKGVLADYPLVGLRATLLDGKNHPVDSDEMSFMMAASLAYKEGIPNAAPVLLEPIYKISITVPDKYMGDIMGDLSKKRGRIMGMQPIKGGHQTINAEAPFAEMFKYATELRSMTQGRGAFTMEFERYEEVPGETATKIIAEAKAKKEAANK
jgi:elongation factor G